MRSGSHLVVHGPPGTGKSQTIANLVATLAADGRRVLFVAEKRAAIDAVVGRLDRVGLGDLVLDLHAGAQGRRRVARELVDGLDRLLPGGVRGERGTGCRGRGRPRVTAPAAARRAAADRLGEHVRRTARATGAVGGVRSTRCRRRSRLRRPAHAAAVAGAAARRRRWPALDRDGAAAAAAGGHDRGVAGRLGRRPGRATPGSAPASARPTRPPRPASASSGSPAASVDDHGPHPRRRVPRHPAAGAADDERLGARARHGRRRPRHPGGLPAGGLRHPARRPRHGDRQLGLPPLGRVRPRLLDRWRLRRQARALLRPGRPPADLHAALAAASEQRVAWRRLAGSGGRPEIPVDLDRARVGPRRARRGPRVARRSACPARGPAPRAGTPTAEP